MPYKNLNELISIAFNALQERPGADMTFIESIQKQFLQKGKLSERQIEALENIGWKELKKRREMGNNLELF